MVNKLIVKIKIIKIFKWDVQLMVAQILIDNLGFIAVTMKEECKLIVIYLWDVLSVK